jgi:geranylgeranyl pyrophosphate synthase
VKQETPDWQPQGPIDLNTHDLPHASSTTEQWSTSGHCLSEGKRQFAFHASFVRKLCGHDPSTRAPRYSHSLTWAIYDLTGKRCAFVSRVDASASQESLRRIRAGLGARDERMNLALRELLEQGEVPLPDRAFDGPVVISQHGLSLDFAGDSFRKLSDGSYELRLLDKRRALGCQLRIAPQKAAVRHGDQGSVRGPDDETLSSYFIPRCEVTGQVFHQGVAQRVTQGHAWYERAFGAGALEELDPAAEAALGKAACEKLQSERRARWRARRVGWTRFSAQLGDGSELSYFAQHYLESGKSASDYVSIVAPDGSTQAFHDAKLEPLASWQSAQTFAEYPVHWRLQVPAAQLELDVRASLDDQEIVSVLAQRAFYEGHVTMTGTRMGRELIAEGFVEQVGAGPSEDVPSLLQQVDKLVRQKVQALVPDQPDLAQAAYLLTTLDKPHYMHGVDVAQYARVHLQPIRTISDRGGDAWRSFTMQTCIEVVGGNARDFAQWIAVPELLHAGALIVEDVENKAQQVRGGESAHHLYGEAQAINSGTAAYFLGAPVLRDGNLSDSQIVALYELYFDALRAAHAGQALELDSFAPLMQRAIESDELAETLTSRVRAVHRLKTGVPMGCLARIAALAGGGTTQQVEALGRFFEDIGQAFQNVEELRRLQNDIAHGRISLPVAHSMTRLPTAERRWLFETLRSRPTQPALLERVAKALESCGAIETSRLEARALAEASWAKLEPLIEGSLAKLRLHAFALYAGDRS